jgi:hypothetical protein
VVTVRLPADTDVVVDLPERKVADTNVLPELKQAPPRPDASLLTVPPSLQLFILSLAGQLFDIRHFLSLSTTCKALHWLVMESDTADVFVWRQQCCVRWPWLNGLHPPLRWSMLFKKYFIATGPPASAAALVHAVQKVLHCNRTAYFLAVAHIWV